MRYTELICLTSVTDFLIHITDEFSKMDSADSRATDGQNLTGCPRTGELNPKLGKVHRLCANWQLPPKNDRRRLLLDDTQSGRPRVLGVGGNSVNVGYAP